jgi:hypothetical protein
MADKVRELELPEFMEEIRKKDEDTLVEAQTAEVDVEAIVAKHKPHIDKYGLVTGVAFAIARIKEAILEANSEGVRGMLVGSRDMFGRNSPLRIPLLSSKGDHMELISWDTRVKMGDAKVELQFPSVATLKVLTEGEFKGVPSIRLVAMENCEQLSMADAVMRLNKIAKSVGAIDGGDELKVVVVKGKINFIAPSTRWENKEKAGNWQLYMPNMRDTPVSHPVLQVTLEAEDGNQVRAVFDRQRNAVPTIMVEDFVDLCADAITQSKDPVEQAKFLGSIVKGREVIIVGFMTKFNPQVNINYIEMGAYAMYDAGASVQSTLGGEKTAGKPAGKPAKKPAKEDAAKKPAGKSKSADSPVDKLKGKIKAYCEMYDVDAEAVTVEQIMDTFKLEGVMTESAVETAIKEVRAGE